ncbi:hypothetical protein AB0M95_05920 [Sphaerisporangium sp. NPDC051017]|uniref:hypothetical protein n=1 Tax=unclassified Sphaerisporangium TaxID=2630420 RepID=UPI0033F2CF01
MPSFDSARDRFRLSPAHLGVLGCLYEGVPVTADLLGARDELWAAGLLGDMGEVIPELATLADVIAEPLVLVQVEITGSEGPTSHGAVIGHHACYVFEGWPGEAESEYVPTDLGALVWSLARVVGLRDRGVKPPVAPVVTTRVAAMDAGFAALARMDPTRVQETAALLRAVLAAEDDLTEPELTIFTHLLLQLNANWRMTAAWPNRDGSGTEVRGITVLDCGPLGYWLCESLAEPMMPGTLTPDGDLRLIFVEVQRVWELIASLLPDPEELPVPAEV